MQKSKSELLKEMDQAHKANDLILYEKLLEEVIELKPHTAIQKIQISDALFNLNRVRECYKILGKERPHTEYATISAEELGLQLELGFILYHQGAYYVGKRIIQKVDQAVKERKLGYTGPLLPLLHYNTCVLSLVGDFKDLEAKARLSFEYYTGKNETLALANRRLLAMALCGLERFDEALGELEKVDAHPANGSYGFNIETLLLKHRALIGMKKNKLAGEILAGLEEEFKKKQIPFHRGFYCEEMGMQHEDPEYFRKSIDHFKEAHQFQSMLKMISRLHGIKPEMLTETEKVMLSHWPTYSRYKLKALSASVFTNGIYLLEKYLGTKEGYLDLYSGCILKDGKIEMLSELHLKALLAIVGTGHVGIGHLALADFVYRENSFDPMSTFERIRKVVSALQGLNIPVTQDEKRYYFDFDNGPSLILPPSDVNIGSHNLIKLAKPDFKRADVEEILMVNKGSAIRLIESWMESGVIKGQGIGKATFYTFQ